MVSYCFRNNSRYLDDLLNIDNPYFEQIECQIYHTELHLSKENSTDTEALVLELDLPITYDSVSAKICDKQDNFNFEVVIFPFLDRDVPRSPSYGEYISKLICLQDCSHVDGFKNRN